MSGIIYWILTRKSSEPEKASEKSLYERLGGIFAIAAVIDYFSDAIINNPLVGKNSPNPQLAHWSTMQLDRLPGLKFMRTLWVADITGGPLKFEHSVPDRGGADLNLANTHRNLKITSAEFDEVAAELARTLDHFKVPEPERSEVLGAFAAHKDEVISGSM